MRCPECGGTVFTNGQFDLAEMFRGRPVVLRNVPALRCDQCGYLSIDLEVAERIQQALTSGKPEATALADVYDLGQVLSTER